MIISSIEKNLDTVQTSHLQFLQHTCQSKTYERSVKEALVVDNCICYPYCGTCLFVSQCMNRVQSRGSFGS